MNISPLRLRHALALLLFAVLLAGCASSRSGGDSDLHAVNIKGRDFPLRADTGRVAVIFYDASACAECTRRLDRALKALSGPDAVMRVLVLANVGTDTVRQRQALNDARALISSKPPVVFDVANGPGALFSRFEATRTPGLLLLGTDLKSPCYIPFNAMFGDAAPSGTSDADVAALAALIRERTKAASGGK